MQFVGVRMHQDIVHIRDERTEIHISLTRNQIFTETLLQLLRYSSLVFIALTIMRVRHDVTVS